MDAPVRRILHVDMDAFYASVEQRDDPALRGRPVAVGGRPENRGVVAAASYEARRFGVRSAMSMARAIRQCPDLVIVPPDFSRYRAASDQVFGIFRQVTDLVEPLSLDEAYLDVTSNRWDEPLGVTVARRIKAEIQAVTGLTASAGVAPNKFLAKVASGWQKPDGLTVIAPGKVEAFLHELPVEALWGVGPVTARRLRTIGVRRLVDVRTVEATRLARTVGSQADWLRRLADGVDERPVVADRVRKSCSSETTFREDVADSAVIRSRVADMARARARWLSDRGLTARTVTIKVRYADFSTVTRSETSRHGTNDVDEITERGWRLLDRTEVGRRPVRLVGLGVHNLGESGEVSDPPDWLPFHAPGRT